MSLEDEEEGASLWAQPSSWLSFAARAVGLRAPARPSSPPWGQGHNRTNLLCAAAGPRTGESDPNWKQNVYVPGNRQDIPAAAFLGQVLQTLQSLGEPKKNGASRQPPGGCSGCNKTGLPTGLL